MGASLLLNSDHDDHIDLDDHDDHDDHADPDHHDDHVDLDDHDVPVVEDALTGGSHPPPQQRHPGLHFEELTVIHARAYQYQYIPCSNSNAFLSFKCCQEF